MIHLHHPNAKCQLKIYVIPLRPLAVGDGLYDGALGMAGAETSPNIVVR